MHQPSAPATARARARAQLTEEIKVAARRQMAEVGASALSLRAVARELGMASSAIYRYFPSRDDLLTSLIVDAYDAVGAAAEAADQRQGNTIERWVAVARAVRRWALENRHDYELVYGSPVPGYRAPTDTISPATRVSAVALGIVADGVTAGEIDTTRSLAIPASVRADLQRLRDAIAPEVPDDVLSRTLLAWTQLFGAISFELFGHLHQVITDDDAFFELQVRRAAQLVVTGEAW